MLIKNANVFLPDGHFSLCDLRYSERIEALGSFSGDEGFDAAGCYLMPGLLDLHTHGALGGDFSDGPSADLAAMARHYAAHGVTGFLATTMTLPEDTLVRAAAHIAAFRPRAGEAACLGVHMEGPFLSYDKRGAQCADYLRLPDMSLFEHVNAACGGRVRQITVAPELEGALPFIERVSRACAVSLGHTAAAYDTAAAAFSAGAGRLTHLYNAMCPFEHRQPGVIGAGMDAGAFAELIVDGLHVHPAAVRAAFRLFPDRIVLISDSLRCAGMPQGEYTLGGQAVALQDGRCTLAGTNTLAGSVITVYDGLINAVRFGVPLESAAAASTHHPAQALHLERERGFLRPGLMADMLLLNPDLSIRSVFIGGREAVCRFD